MKKIIFVFLVVSIPFTTGLSNNKLVVNIGYKQNYSCLDQPEVINAKIKLHGININLGIKKNNFEYGVYYGIGDMQKYGKLDVQYGVVPSSVGNMHNFGLYSNFYLSSFIKNNDFFVEKFNFYATVKMGGYFVPEKDSDFSPNGLGFNCFPGFGASYYLFKRFGLFGETGYDYYPTVNHVKMSKVLFRIGISVRL
ncbi:MAG: hypothetical protein LBL24_03900 [Bacteroidales bacterium]|jgi:hypothetical protein|nr:hypothetical protein [Bacteroidales bacterium]